MIVVMHWGAGMRARKGFDMSVTVFRNKIYGQYRWQDQSELSVIRRLFINQCKTMFWRVTFEFDIKLFMQINRPTSHCCWISTKSRSSCWNSVYSGLKLKCKVLDSNAMVCYDMRIVRYGKCCKRYTWNDCRCG